MDSPSIQTARDYLLESSIFEDDKYKWLHTILRDILTDKYTSTQAKELIDSLYPIEKISSEQSATNITSQDQETQFVKNTINLKQIKLINKIINVGLIDLDKQISLKEGLNIFYGKNGSGKSSIYQGICKALGKNKDILCKIGDELNDSTVDLQAIDEDGNHIKITLQSPEENIYRNINIFDSQISRFLIESDQENEFKVAHLEMEYFKHLLDGLDDLGILLESRKNEFFLILSGIKDKLREVFPEIVDEIENLDENIIKDTNLTEKESKQLEGLRNKLNILVKSNPDDKLRNLNNCLYNSGTVVNAFFRKEEPKSEEEEATYTFRLSQDTITQINMLIKKYSDLKKAESATRENELKGIVPDEMLKSELWSNFISSSLELVNSFDKHSQHTYKNEKCPYCQQNLLDDNSKKLLKHYHAIKKDNKQKLQDYETKIARISTGIRNAISSLDNIEQIKKVIEPELTYLGIEKQDLTMDEIGVSLTLASILESIEKLEQISISDAESKILKNFTDYYLEINKTTLKKTSELEVAIKKKDTTIKEIKEAIQPLEYTEIIQKYKKSIIQAIRTNQAISNIYDNQSGITNLRRFIGRQQTQYAEEEMMKQFEGYLKKEYEQLRFKPSPFWNLKPHTRDGKQVRSYRMGDYRVSEIFSEGEQKIHALADFFATSEFSEFHGIYIFDDPVNSLDEGNIERIAERILRLIEDGNQVIVFTHNLIFLNSLIQADQQSVTNIKRYNSKVVIEPGTVLASNDVLQVKLNDITDRFEQLKKRELEDISTSEIQNLYDLMSGFLESYVEIKIMRNIINRYRINIQVYKLNQLYSLDKATLEPIYKFYNKTSRRGARHANPVHVTEFETTFEEAQEDFEYLKTTFPIS